MNFIDYSLDLMLSVFLIVGAYQFYFWCQRHPLAASRELKVKLDERIPYRPNWVWIYSFLYYPAILYLNWVVDSPAQFTRMAANFLLLLGLQMVFFIGFPVATPASWRQLNARRTLAERFLAYVQRVDAPSNCFPSMHVSVATLTALYLYPTLGPWAILFPILIAASAVFTKQHYLADLPAGAALGWATFKIFARIA
ncbi:MAG TPA: phosphatase PAP2 family protein [Candidatus Binatia bacterium]|jgi:membrane-associated phospholipid phosphatase